MSSDNIFLFDLIRSLFHRVWIMVNLITAIVMLFFSTIFVGLHLFYRSSIKLLAFSGAFLWDAIGSLMSLGCAWLLFLAILAFFGLCAPTEPFPSLFASYIGWGTSYILIIFQYIFLLLLIYSLYKVLPDLLGVAAQLQKDPLLKTLNLLGGALWILLAIILLLGQEDIRSYISSQDAFWGENLLFLRDQYGTWILVAILLPGYLLNEWLRPMTEFKKGNLYRDFAAEKGYTFSETNKEDFEIPEKFDSPKIFSPRGKKKFSNIIRGREKVGNEILEFDIFDCEIVRKDLRRPLTVSSWKFSHPWPDFWMSLREFSLLPVSQKERMREFKREKFNKLPQLKSQGEDSESDFQFTWHTEDKREEIREKFITPSLRELLEKTEGLLALEFHRNYLHLITFPIEFELAGIVEKKQVKPYLASHIELIKNLVPKIPTEFRELGLEMDEDLSEKDSSEESDQDEEGKDSGESDGEEK